MKTTAKAFIIGNFIGYEGKEGAEVNVVKITFGNQSIVFEPNLVDDGEENQSRLRCGQQPINQFNFALLSDVKWIRIEDSANTIKLKEVK
jgi:hypothetical protein